MTSVSNYFTGKDTNTKSTDTALLDGSVKEEKAGYQKHDVSLDIQIETDDKRFIYDVHENPPILMTIFFAMQQVLMSLAQSLSTSLLVADVVCAKRDESFKARLLSTTMFISGLTTFIQTTIGVRLPVYQGPAATFVIPLLALASLPEMLCIERDGLQENTTTISLKDEISFKTQQLEGSLIIAGTFQMMVGLTGLIGMLLRFVGPVTIVPALTIVGLQAYKATTRFAKAQWGMSMLTVSTAVILSFYLRHRQTPVPSWSRNRGFHIKWFPFHKVFSVLLACLTGWAVSGILTATGVLSDDPKSDQFYARTDSRTYVIEQTDWFILPYPGQFGPPGFHAGALATFLLSTISSIIDSVGDYYACSKICFAPPPPKHAINRGIAVEGMMSLIGGSAGTAHATSTFGGNIGAIGITRVASLRVFQVVGLVFILFGIVGKIGAIFVTIPYPVVGGLMMINFGVLIGVMLSNLQFVDLNSTRNVGIIGMSMLMSVIFPYWIDISPNAIDTGVEGLNSVITMLLANPAFIAGFSACFMDNTIPGTQEERGMHHWQAELGAQEDENEKDTTAQEDKTRHKMLIRTIYTVPFSHKISRKLPLLKLLPFYPK